ncbi:MAG TPA: sensor domain-containing diguanylate cyclase [Aquabacterium sp.]|nr:sensor domain-containing diguanylate cyclase [Aquabacterium sp.]
MATPTFDALNLLSTPVWIVLPEGQEILFSNSAAQALAPDSRMDQLRHGSLSAHAQYQLEAYLPALSTREQVVEILTIQKSGKSLPLTCRLSLANIGSAQPAILFEGLPDCQLANLEAAMAGAAAPKVDNPDERRFYERLFRTNTAPMLLIDPAADGRIVDANLAATQFYGYSREEMCLKHTWDINALGRDVLPIMHEVARLPGGHKPLNFTHKLADGSHRQVQTYAGPVELNGKRLMLCIVHDITEQKRLEHELEKAALRDPLTGLWNRRQFLHLVDHAHAQTQRYGHVYSLMLMDVDHFKSINDQCGHHKGDEVLLFLAKTLESRVRESDAVCRWGGEEFVILLPQTALDGAVSVAECLRSTIEDMAHPDYPQFTVSIGVAQRLEDEDSEALFKRVDEALYRAKSAGRNRVFTAQH